METQNNSTQEQMGTDCNCIKDVNGNHIWRASDCKTVGGTLLDIRGYSKYCEYLREQRATANKLLFALRLFEANADFPAFSFIEEDINSLTEKLKNIARSPEQYSREFSADEWDD